jgi:hypothetical protein
MADIPAKLYTGLRQRKGAGNTAQFPPSFEESFDPQLTPGSENIVKVPVDISYASEAAMIADQNNQSLGYLYFDGTNTYWLREKTGVIGDYETFGGGNFVTLDTDQTITGGKTFDNPLLIQSGSNPVMRIKTTDNTATINFRNVFNEDQAGIELNTPSNKLSIVTKTANTDIEINPNGTGSILLPNVAIGTGTALGVNASNEVVKISDSSLRFSQLDPDFTKIITGLNTTPSDFFGEETVSIIEPSLLIGSRNFDSGVECDLESIYRINAQIKVITGGGIPAPTFSIRVNIFGYEIRPPFTYQAGSSTTYRHLIDTNIEISFKTVAGVKKLSTILNYTVTDESLVIKSFYTDGSGSDSTKLYGDITGSSDLDILIGGTQSTNASVMNIICKKIN